MQKPTSKKIKLIKPANPNPDNLQSGNDSLITTDITPAKLKSKFTAYKKYRKDFASNPDKFFQSCDFNVSALQLLIAEYTIKHGKAPQYLRVYYGIESQANGKDDNQETSPFLYTAPVDESGQLEDSAVLASYAPCPPRGNCSIDGYTAD
jgi:hypothetical protein